MEEPDWEDLHYFSRLAQLRTLSATARSLGVTHATVARRIQRFEESFAGPLFERNETGFHLNAVGQLIHEQLLEMEAKARAVTDLRQNARTQRRRVRITVPRSMADGFLVPRICELQSGLDGVELNILTENRLVSLARSNAEIAVRLGQPSDTDSIGRHVADIAYRLYCHRDAPIAARELLIGSDSDDASAEASWLNARAGERCFAFRSNSQIAQLQAAASGMGTALLPSYLVTAQSGLCVVDGPSPPDRPIWILARREALRLDPVRRVFDALVAVYQNFWPADQSR